MHCSFVFIVHFSLFILLHSHIHHTSAYFIFDLQRKRTSCQRDEKNITLWFCSEFAENVLKIQKRNWKNVLIFHSWMNPMSFDEVSMIKSQIMIEAINHAQKMSKSYQISSVYWRVGWVGSLKKENSLCLHNTSASIDFHKLQRAEYNKRKNINLNHRKRS